MIQMLDEKYTGHTVFEELIAYSSYYDSLSDSISSFVSMGTTAQGNIDSYVFMSMKGTLDSIHDILLKGRINDAYALLRKYYDSVIINIYCILYLEDNVNMDNFIVAQINNWLKGTEALPTYRIMSDYIRNSAKLKSINDLLYKDTLYRSLRDRCNDHSHYNFFHNLLINNSELYLQNRIQTLDSLSADLRNIFILHFAYLFSINDHYMSSSDYIDALDCGLTPEEGSQEYVAPFIQSIFDSIIKISRPDIATEMLARTSMKLE